jgi:iron complex transport system substrate-binding protein
MTPLRTTALFLAGVLASALTGCSTGATERAQGATNAAATTKVEPGAYPVTLQHALGSTTIGEEPQRVVTLGWSDQDVALALGVAPVGAVKITWGGNRNDSTPWYDARLKELGAAQPTRYDDADGVPFEDIAALDPDLVLATNSGLTKSDYRRLTKIAPVVAYPGAPWGTSWQDSTALVGKALGRPTAAEELVHRVEAEVQEGVAARPELDGTSFVFATFDLKDTSQVGYYTPLDNRPLMLEDLGMRNAPVVEKLSNGSNEFWKTVSAERAATLESDMIMFYGETAADEDVVADDPLLGQIPAIRSGARLMLLDKTDALTMSAPSPLAVPWFVERLLPAIADTAAKARAS